MTSTLTKGFVWFCSKDKDQQKLLKISSSFAKKNHPEIPQCVFTQSKSFTPEVDNLIYLKEWPSQNNLRMSMFHLLESCPFDYNHILSNKTMIINNIEHLINDNKDQVNIRINHPRKTQGNKDFPRTSWFVDNTYLKLSKSSCKELAKFYNKRNIGSESLLTNWVINKGKDKFTLLVDSWFPTSFNTMPEMIKKYDEFTSDRTIFDLPKKFFETIPFGEVCDIEDLDDFLRYMKEIDHGI